MRGLAAETGCSPIHNMARGGQGSGKAEAIRCSALSHPPNATYALERTRQQVTGRAKHKEDQPEPFLKKGPIDLNPG